MKKLKNVTWA